MDSTSQDFLRKLLNQPLTTVVFVMDYLQIAFDNIRLTIVSEPHLIVRDRTVPWEAREFCHVLREQIGRCVKFLSADDKQVILEFENDVKLSIPLQADPPRVEHLIVEDGAGGTWVA